MNFTLIDKNAEQDLDRILQLIMLRKNGVVSDALRQSGLDYKKVWGVSIPHLRSISKEFEGKHSLALMLWGKGWRETMILASMIEDVTQVQNNQLSTWLRSTHNMELAEQVAFNLLSRIKLPLDSWLPHLTNLESYAALSVLKGLYRHVLNKQYSLTDIERLIDFLLSKMNTITEPSEHLISVVGQLFAVSGRTQPGLIKSILQRISKFALNNTRWQRMVEIAETEYSWVNEQ